MKELRKDLERHADDPVVRRTIRRLRLSIVAVVIGVAACALIAAAAASLSFSDGMRRGVEAATGVPAARTALDTARSEAIAAQEATPTAKSEAQRRRQRERIGARRKQTQQRLRAARKDHAGAHKRAETLLAVSDGERPGAAVLAVLMVGFVVAGVAMFAVVRRPYAGAREHALELVHAWKTQQSSTLEALAALNATVEAKDRYTAGHGLRVTLISILIGQELDLHEQRLDLLRHAATFHDIGKIAVPDAVLQKQGRLTDEEYDKMKVHPVESARICGKLAALRDCVPDVRGHHERVDGTGYPDGLVGEQIPLGARIIAVADAWDAITSDRPYRRGQPAGVALDEIRRCAGTQFDPRVVRAFVEVLARDPWMFGLTPADVMADPAAPGRRPEPPSRAVEELTRQVRELTGRHGEPGDDIDWSGGFDEEDLAA